MSRYAVVKDGKVENVIEWDGKAEWLPPDGSIAAKIPSGLPVGIGWGHDGINFIPSSLIQETDE